MSGCGKKIELPSRNVVCGEENSGPHWWGVVESNNTCPCGNWCCSDCRSEKRCYYDDGTVVHHGGPLAIHKKCEDEMKDKKIRLEN